MNESHMVDEDSDDYGPVEWDIGLLPFFATGEKLYGIVDRVPGVCHVSTLFFHFFYLPLVPTGSYVVLYDAPAHVVLPTRLSIKSILMAFARVILLLAMLLSGFFVIITFFILFSGEWQPLAISVVVFACAVGARRIALRLEKASTEREAQLCSFLGSSLGISVQIPQHSEIVRCTCCGRDCTNNFVVCPFCEWRLDK